MLDPFLTEAWTNLGALYHAQGQKEKALSAYFKAKDVNPNSADVDYDLGVVYALDRNFNKAKRYWQEALLKAPNHADAKRALRELKIGEIQ